MITHIFYELKLKINKMNDSESITREKFILEIVIIYEILSFNNYNKIKIKR